MFHFGTCVVAVLEDVGGQPHRRLGRVDVVAARHVLLEHVVLDRAAQLLGGDALFLADQLVEQQQDRRRGVDRHRGRDAVERDLVEADPHVLDRVDRDAGAADLAVAERVVGVAAELGRQVEGHREAGRAVLDQVAVALVGVLGRGEAGVLAHRPEPVAVHALVDAAGEGRRAGLAEPLLQPGRDVVLGVEALDLDPRVGEDPLVVGPDHRRDRAVGLLGRGLAAVLAIARQDIESGGPRRRGALAPLVEQVGEAPRERDLGREAGRLAQAARVADQGRRIGRALEAGIVAHRHRHPRRRPRAPRPARRSSLPGPSRG